MNTRHFLLLWLSLFIYGALCAQVIRSNAKGEKIIVYKDGRMEYFNGDPVAPEDYPTEEGYPIIEAHIEPLDGTIALNEADLYKVAQRRAQISRAAAELATLRLGQAADNVLRLERQLNALPTDDPSRESLQKELQAAQKTLAQTRAESSEAELTARNDDALAEKGAYIAVFNETQRTLRLNEARYRDVRTAADQPYEQLLPLMDNAVATGSQNLLARPPAKTCAFSHEATDEATGYLRRDLEPALLFTYTDERLRPYLKEKEYMVCRGYLSSLAGYRFLTLEFVFAYPNAREAYGFIDENSVLTIKMLNGGFVNLRAGEMDRGKYNTTTQELTYAVTYPIDRNHLALLKQSEVDLIRVFWSSGYEEYPVYQLDFFQQQLRCLGD